MVSGGFNEEFASPIPASRFFKAAVTDSHNLIPKIASDRVSSIELLQGDGGVGTIKQYNFTGAAKEFGSLKNLVEIFDEVNFVYKYSVIDGPKSDKYEFAKFQVKFEPSADGGSVVKISAEFKTVGDYVPSEEEGSAPKQGLVMTFKGVEAYLLANPDAYV